MNLTLKRLSQKFTVCKVANISLIDFTDEFCFVGKTDEEISLVCTKEKLPENTIEREDDWRAFRIEGTLDFSLVGILSKISGLLAENAIGIFAVSTFNTDYVLVKEENFDKAINLLHINGYSIL